MMLMLLRSRSNDLSSLSNRWFLFLISPFLVFLAMGKKTHYAVRQGFDGPKIYRTWPECQRAVTGFKGAQFKGFCSEAEAMAYLGGAQQGATEAPPMKKPRTSPTIRPPSRLEKEQRSASALGGALPGAGVLYFDGGSRGNPGAAGSGAALYSAEGAPLWRGWNYISHATNNEAEYDGVLSGMAAALELGIKDLQVYGDSKMIIMQLKDEWKCRAEHLQPLYRRAKETAGRFRRFRADHVYREANAEADRLANMAMDGRESGSEKGDHFFFSTGKPAPHIQHKRSEVGSEQDIEQFCQAEEKEGAGSGLVGGGGWAEEAPARRGAADAGTGQAVSHKVKDYHQEEAAATNTTRRKKSSLLVVEEEEVEEADQKWSAFTVLQLKEELKRRGLKVSGLKIDLIARLQQSDY